MKYLILFLVCSALMATQLAVTAQDTSDDTAVTADETNTNATTTGETSSNTTTGGNSTGTPSGDNSTETSTPTPALSMTVPTLSADCMMVYKNCTSQMTVTTAICSKLEDDDDCLTTEKEINNATKVCSTQDVELLKEFCFGTSLLESASLASVGATCQTRVVALVSGYGDELEDINKDSGSHCAFLDAFEDQLKTAENTAVCTAEEYTDLHTEICFACRGTVASLALIISMVMAQWLF